MHDLYLTAELSQSTFSTAPPLHYPCFSLVHGKMSHSLPLITSKKLMSPTHTEHPPCISPPSLFTCCSLSLSHKHTLQFHLKWCWSHFRKILQTFSAEKPQLFVCTSVGGQSAIIRSYCSSTALCWLFHTANWLHSVSLLSDESLVSLKRCSEFCSKRGFYAKIHLFCQLKRSGCVPNPGNWNPTDPNDYCALRSGNNCRTDKSNFRNST